MAVAGESMLSRALITTKNPCISFKNNVSATPSLPRGCQILKRKYCRLRTKVQAAQVQVNVVENEKTLKSDLSLGLDVVSEGELREKGFLGMRKTKMVCTIGPACCSMEDIERLAMGGMNVARLNMCHNTRDWHLDVIRKIKSLNHEKGFCVSVMIDTEGSQIHVVDHGERTSVKVEEDSVWLFTAIKFEGSRPFTAQANYAGFSEGIEVGDELVIDGGMASFEVIQKVGNDLRCKCTDPGLFLPRAKLSFWRQGKLVERNYGLPTLSKKIKNFIFMSALQDWDDIEFGIAEGVDFVAMSFVSDADSVRHLKKYISTISSKSIKVLAKIETLESLQKLEEIVEASDGIMVARGDLGVQIPLEQIPTVQEKITQVCRHLNKPVIVASQLLESMVEYPIPTRAEVADVSEAIRQYADALMLSGESAIGPNGLKAISVLRMASSRMELWNREENRQSSLLDHPQLGASLEDRVADQICSSAVDMANKLGVDAIFVYTKHGHMASLLSGNRPNPPIFAFTNEDSTRKAMNLQWGVIPLLVNLSDDMDANIANTIDLIKRKEMLKNGDAILVVSDLTPAHVTSTAFQSIQVKTIV